MARGLLGGRLSEALVERKYLIRRLVAAATLWLLAVLPVWFWFERDPFIVVWLPAGAGAGYLLYRWLRGDAARKRTAGSSGQGRRGPRWEWPVGLSVVTAMVLSGIISRLPPSMEAGVFAFLVSAVGTALARSTLPEGPDTARGSSCQSGRQS